MECEISEQSGLALNEVSTCLSCYRLEVCLQFKCLSMSLSSKLASQVAYKITTNRGFVLNWMQKIMEIPDHVGVVIIFK